MSLKATTPPIINIVGALGFFVLTTVGISLRIEINSFCVFVVPGITSASGCSTYSGIPLTHRDYAQSCIFVTGHLKKGKLELDWEKLIQENQTIVFYMGLVSIDIICEQLIQHGLSELTPCALIQQGTTNTQKEFISILKDMPTVVKTKKPKAPTKYTSP